MKTSLISLVATIGRLFSVAVSSAQQIDEVCFGGTWAQPEWLEASHPEDNQVSIGAERFFNSVNIDLFGHSDSSSSKFMTSIFNPRPHVGAMVSLDDDGTSYTYTGFTWHFDVDEIFFIETSFGFSVNNGEKDKSSSDRASLGSNFLFHESIGFGVNVTEDVMMVLAVEHLSHASLFSSQNKGLSNASLRVGHKF